eukprot:TRINITY_DN1389_c0_g1_i2.p1 TRINITY_DN1389_c0_g1~~TRINITY_DN1389_c0_g1_i2.p1  ORF type:complete len:243 (-),score=47.47 TRINITY_DN1389_c0_g1_i2:600-1328(-)
MSTRDINTCATEYNKHTTSSSQQETVNINMPPLQPAPQMNSPTTLLDDSKPHRIYDLLTRDNHPLPSLVLSDDDRKDKYLVVLSTILSQLVLRGDQLKSTSKYFRSASGRLPPIGLEAYIARLLQYAPCDKECFLTALVYMDRLAEKTSFIYNSMNIHRSYLTSLMIAAKFFEDQPCDNGYFATVGGVSVQEVNSMELAFLSMLEFRVAINGSDFSKYATVTEAKADQLIQPKISKSETGHC